MNDIVDVTRFDLEGLKDKIYIMVRSECYDVYVEYNEKHEYRDQWIKWFDEKNIFDKQD